MLYQRELATLALCEEMFPLLRMHFDEIAHYKDIPLKPDFDLYLRLEETGCLRVFTARDDESGKLIGYSVFFLKHNIHYSSSLQATQDILYIDPERRGFGAKFILWCDRELTKENVEVVYHHVKAKHNFGPMLERMGYELVDLIYARRLNGSKGEN